MNLILVTLGKPSEDREEKEERIPRREENDTVLLCVL